MRERLVQLGIWCECHPVMGWTAFLLAWWVVGSAVVGAAVAGGMDFDGTLAQQRFGMLVAAVFWPVMVALILIGALIMVGGSLPLLFARFFQAIQWDGLAALLPFGGFFLGWLAAGPWRKSAKSPVHVPLGQ